MPFKEQEELVVIASNKAVNMVFIFNMCVQCNLYCWLKTMLEIKCCKFLRQLYNPHFTLNIATVWNVESVITELMWGSQQTRSSLPCSRGLAASHSCDWNLWWGCCHQQGKWPSWVERPHVPSPSPVKYSLQVNTTYFLNSLLFSLLLWRLPNPGLPAEAYLISLHLD